MSRRIGIGLYGANGHQLGGLPAGSPAAAVVACAAMPVPQAWPQARVHGDLDALLADPAVELVSLCSPRRRDQAQDALRCLRAGRHVLAEKPCAMSEQDLDAILAEADRRGLVFHEMAGSVFEAPFPAIARLVRSGAIGRVVQVFAQKSYPMHDQRPADEDVDGGLLLQVGVHALRWVEQVSGVRIDRVVAAVEGAHDGGRLAACSLTCAGAGGVPVSVVLNYANPRAFGSWGNECLRIFGDGGLIELADGGLRTRHVDHHRDHGSIDPGPAGPGWLDLVLAHVGGAPMPIDHDAELHPLRVLLRARASRLQL
ncbi:MAG: Gfo/Idh/MocA family oxidoreductase [Planctomycetes bacterium]|nr:Gfo/Idh/MocA family oxidoreductase [Planctomycetota bacterium]